MNYPVMAEDQFIQVKHGPDQCDEGCQLSWSRCLSRPRRPNQSCRFQGADELRGIFLRVLNGYVKRFQDA